MVKATRGDWLERAVGSAKHEPLRRGDLADRNERGAGGWVGQQARGMVGANDDAELEIFSVAERVLDRGHAVMRLRSRASE